MFQDHNHKPSLKSPSCLYVHNIWWKKSFRLVGRRTRVVAEVGIHEEQTWEEARDKCDELGLRLMTINSKQKNTGVEQLLQGLDDE